MPGLALFGDRVSNGLALARAAFGVLCQNGRLICFPLLSGGACLLLLGGVVAPLASSPAGREMFLEAQSTRDVLAAAALLFVVYFICFTITLFFKAALISVTLLHLDGRPYTISLGVRLAWSRFARIVAWSCIASTAGLALRFLEDRSRSFTRMMAGALGAAWSATTYFVLPTILVERDGPSDAIKRSTAMMRATWGEAATGAFKLGVLTGLVLLLGLIPPALGLALGSPELLFVGGAAFVAWAIVVGVASATTNGVMVAMLYAYARSGGAPAGMNAELLQNAFSGEGARAAFQRVRAENAAAQAVGNLPAPPDDATDTAPTIASIRDRGAA